MHDMLEIGEPELAEEWMRGKLSRKEKVMGFGHRVYKNGDSRVPTMKKAFLDVAAHTGGEKWVRMYDILETTMGDATGIEPNLDFPTGGPAYYLMGFDIEVFTPDLRHESDHGGVDRAHHRTVPVQCADSSTQRVHRRPAEVRRGLTITEQHPGVASLTVWRLGSVRTVEFDSGRDESLDLSVRPR